MAEKTMTEEQLKRIEQGRFNHWQMVVPLLTAEIRRLWLERDEHEQSAREQSQGYFDRYIAGDR